MKRRIEQLLNGVFEYEQRKLSILPEKLELRCAPGKILRGAIRIGAGTGGRVHGFLYCPDPRMLCDPAEFQGITNEIRYQFDAGGLKAGAEKNGTMTVCSDCGEYVIPYSVRIEEARQEKKPIPFTDTDGFVKLARENFQKAYRCFLLPEFRKILKEPQQLALYDGLGVGGFSYSRMEEFLTGSGLKEPIVFSAEERSWEFPELSEPAREILTLNRSGWGFQTVKVESDARFVRPERSLFTTDEFAGSTFELGLILDTNLMHAGKNYARVTVRAGRQILTAEITARRAGRKTDADHRTRKQLERQLEQFYLDFRLHRLDKDSWIAQSQETIKEWRRAGGTEPLLELFLVQLFCADGKKQKAKKQLEFLEAQKNRLNTSERYAYYLYITTFFRQEDSWIDHVEEEVSRMLARDGTLWRLQWILLYLKEQYLRDKEARFEAVAEQFQRGCRSRIMYLEAWQALQDGPFLLRRLDAFERNLLHFADREKVLTEEVLLQAASLVTGDTAFDRQLFEALAHGYERYPSAELLKAICRILIQGKKTGAEYFGWYEKGVAGKLKLTGLYEAFMTSMECTDFSALPQIIRMYFTYDTSLNYRKRAAVYSGIVKNRKAAPQIWCGQRAAIEKFTADQLEQGHVTDDLAVLYHELLKESQLTRQTAERLARILFSYELHSSRPDVKQFVVRSARCRDEQTFSAADGRAVVRIYDPESVVFAVDAAGARYEAVTGCDRKPLFESDEMLSWCAKKAPEFPGLVLFLCAQCEKSGLINQKLLPYFRAGCSMKRLSSGFLDGIRGMLLNYYLAHPREDSLPDFLDSISLEDYVQVDKAALIALLAEEGRCREAFALLDRYGAEEIPLIRLVRICSRMVLELEFEENQMLLALCLQCFENGKYDDKLLRYLLLYYEGPVETMTQVWRAACAFDLDTVLLEEKIMMMLLFTHSGTQGSEPVFEAYRNKMGRKKLCRAYVNLKAYEYFVRGLPVAEPVFRFIEEDYSRLSGSGKQSGQQEVCRLALLQYYARMPELSAEQKTYAADLLEEFGAKGMRFGFWQQLPAELLSPFQMEGRVFAEYAGDPRSTVTIFWRYRGGEETWAQEQVKNCFEGIFVREFTLFAGEELECRFEEVRGSRKKSSDPLILRADADKAAENSRYGLLNRISEAVGRGDEKEAMEALESYFTLEYLAEKVFAS